MEAALRDVLETYIFYRPDVGYVSCLKGGIFDHSHSNYTLHLISPSSSLSPF